MSWPRAPVRAISMARHRGSDGRSSTGSTTFAAFTRARRRCPSYREESGRGYLPLALALDPVLGERMAEAIDA